MPRVQLGKYPVYGDPNSLKQKHMDILLLDEITEYF